MSSDPQVSVVLPCLNEEGAIGICIGKIREVFAREGLAGEIIVVDNGSTDRSAAVAAAAGARVVLEARKGYGSAYLRGLREARGRLVVIGDSDNTYDFNEIPLFLEPLRSGRADLVIGSRFRGRMQKGAMSWSHRYLGNPVLSGIFRLFFRTRLSDIHCGMRAFTREAYQAMQLRTLGMEFASEMVFSALNRDLRIVEVPVSYAPREGESKLSPLYDAWRHLRFMLLYCPVWLYFVPGAAGFTVGMALLLMLVRGPVLFWGHNWDVHLMVFASVLSILFYQILHLGVYAHTFAIQQGFVKYDPLTRFFQRTFNLERGIALGGAIGAAGFGLLLFIFFEWFGKDFGALERVREALLGLTLVVIGLQTVYSSFFISFLYLERQ